jgi:lipopolysaccharide/colanic/teichoic acid biosynthesis glycosyltransferase
MEKMKPKRLFDIFFSTIGLILLLPLFGVIAVLIKLGGPGPVLFVQKRMGRGARPFDLYKFRTMVPGAPDQGGLITTANDPRITKIGRILRKIKVDELPQLWNVFRGDMSLVGPRPEVEKYVTIYKEAYEEILSIRPGITDIASLTYSDEETILKDKPDPEKYYIHVLLPEKIKLAREYVRKASLTHDLKLILFTIFKIMYPQDKVLKLITALTPYRRPIVIGIQLGIFIISNYLAFIVRFEAQVPRWEFFTFLKYLPILIMIRVALLYAFSLEQGLWRYASIKDLFNIGAATTLGTIMFFFIVRVLLGDMAGSIPFLVEIEERLPLGFALLPVKRFLGPLRCRGLMARRMTSPFVLQSIFWHRSISQYPPHAASLT